MEIKDYPNYLIYPDGRIWGNKTKGRKEGFMKSLLFTLNINQVNKKHIK